MIDPSISNFVIPAALRAGEAIMEIYRGVEIASTLKEDRSPLTLADQQADDIIHRYLESTGIPILSEESLKQPWSVRKDWQSCWIVDPLDGTKEFLKRNDEFTVNIALAIHGKPVLGVIFAPATGEFYYGIEGTGAFKALLTTPQCFAYSATEVMERTIQLPLPLIPSSPFTVVASRSHSNAETEAFIGELRKLHPDLVLQSRGSSLKLCQVAEGKAAVYPRYAPTMEWDTAAGHAIAVAAGCRVYNPLNGEPLTYNKEDLLNPWFIVQRVDLSVFKEQCVQYSMSERLSSIEWPVKKQD